MHNNTSNSEQAQAVKGGGVGGSSPRESMRDGCIAPWLLLRQCCEYFEYFELVFDSA